MSKDFKEIKIRKLVPLVPDNNTGIKKRGSPVKIRKLESTPMGGIEIYKAFFSPAKIEIEGRLLNVMISSFNNRTKEVVVLCEIFRGEITPCRNMKGGWYYYSVYERNYAYSKDAGRINLALIQR